MGCLVARKLLGIQDRSHVLVPLGQTPRHFLTRETCTGLLQQLVLYLVEDLPQLGMLSPIDKELGFAAA